MLKAVSVRVTQVEGMKLKATCDGLSVVSGRVDEASPPEGMSPGKLMAASLGLCMGMHVAGYLARHGIRHGGFEVTVDQTNADNPRRCGAFTATIRVNAPLTEDQKRSLLEEADRCYVGNTLRSGAQVEVRLGGEP